MKNFISVENLELKPSTSIKSFITASSEINECLITNVLQEDKNIWLSDDYLPQEIIMNFRNIKLKEYPKKLTAIGIYCWNKYPTNPKIIEVLISKEQGNNFISLGHFDLSFKAGRQLIYFDDENDIELEELLNTIDFHNLIIKLIIKETFGGKHTYINNLYLYDNIDTNNINASNNMINDSNNIPNNENNNIHEDYIYISENDGLHNNNINEINSDNKDQNIDLNQLNDKNGINDNINQEIIDDIHNLMKQNLMENNGIQYINTGPTKYNKNKIASKTSREIKTPKILKAYENIEERPMTAKTLNNRNINTTVRQYNNKNILDTSNNNGIYNPYNNMSSSNKLNYLINEFRNYRENQEFLMNNYESRVRILEGKCNELKNNLKRMNATMNSIIDSQYSQNQASNDYFIRECHNMVNEAIVNILSNMGNYNTYSPPLYGNQNMYNRNFNNFNYGNNMNIRRNNYNNFMNKEKRINKEMEYNNEINNNDIYNENNMSNDDFDFYRNNENKNINNIDNINNNDNGHEEEYLEREINNNNNNNIDEKQNNININIDNENNNKEYFENENEQIINYDKDINNNSNNIKLNSSNNTSNKNTDNKTIQSLHSNDLYNDGLMPYDEKLKNFSHKGTNTFSQSTNNYRINKANYYANNNNTLENNTTSNILMKSKSNSNMKNKILDSKKEINNGIQIFTEKRISKTNMENNLSSDNSSDDIQINTELTENILKPTLEKFENYININNFGKSQSVYSTNASNAKKEIFGNNKLENIFTPNEGNKENINKKKPKQKKKIIKKEIDNNKNNNSKSNK